MYNNFFTYLIAYGLLCITRTGVFCMIVMSVTDSSFSERWAARPTPSEGSLAAGGGGAGGLAAGVGLGSPTWALFIGLAARGARRVGASAGSGRLRPPRPTVAPAPFAECRSSYLATCAGPLRPGGELKKKVTFRATGQLFDSPFPSHTPIQPHASSPSLTAAG